MEGCGTFMKVSLIISNFLILVSNTNEIIAPSFTIIITSQKNIRFFAQPSNIFPTFFLDRRFDRLRPRDVDVDGTIVFRRHTRNKSIPRNNIHTNRNRCHRRITIVSRLPRCVERSSLHAPNGTDWPLFPFDLKNIHVFQYFIIMLVIFVTMLLGGILGFVYREKVKTSLKHEMISSLKFYGNSQENGKAITKAWDTTQENLFCCGVTGPEDWGNHIPISCCIESAPNKRQPCSDLFTIGTRHNEGCLNATMELIEQQTLIISIAAACAAFIMVSITTSKRITCNFYRFQLLGMIFSCSLFKLIK